jgi:hypothetical protein
MATGDGGTTTRMNEHGVLMSVARIGTGAAAVGLGVLASLAFTAAPSWAAGNSANAAPGALLAQDGSAFKNAGGCTRYGAQGGQIAGVSAVAEPASGGGFFASFSGFGLKPNSRVFVGARYQPSGVSVGSPVVEVGSNGEFSESETKPCEEGMRGRVGSLVIEATTAAGSVFLREFPAPTGC